MHDVFITGNPRSGTSFTRWLFRDAGYFVTNEFHIGKALKKHINAIQEKIGPILGRQPWRKSRGDFSVEDRMDNIVRDVIISMSTEDIYRERNRYDVFLNKTPGLDFDIIDSLFSAKPKYVVCVRHPYKTILSMCNTNNGAEVKKAQGYNEGDFYRCYTKFVEFSNKFDSFTSKNKNKNRSFVIQVDKLNNYESRVLKVKEMFAFAGLEFKFEGKFKELVKTWQIKNAGDWENYSEFSKSQRDLLKNDEDLNRICCQYGYNMKDHL
tara:strand:- start:938 stop:1735 length:798 start_codon:yes stop_codon:yes gene_type:complete